MKYRLILLVVLLAGCAHIEKARQIVDVITDEPAAPALPVNPPIPPAPEGSHAQSFEIMRKEYDASWRVRWPSAFAPMVGEGSYTMLDGIYRADFRSWDTDNGSRRPSYTMPYGAWDGRGEVLAILYDKFGVPRGWVRRGAGDRGPINPDAGN